MPLLVATRPVDGHSHARGFTFLAVAVVIGLLSVITAIALPVGKHLVIQARARAVQSDLRAFTAAFQAYATEHGDWPPGDGTPGAIPDGMAKLLRSTDWQRPAPIGGHYAWDPNSVHQGVRHRATLVIVSTTDSRVSNDRTQLVAIDRTLDDGDLTSGNFLLGYRNYPLYVLEH